MDTRLGTHSGGIGDTRLIMPEDPAPIGASTMNHIGIVGAGTMGAGIAQIAASAGMSVVLQDVSATALERALQRISVDLDRRVHKSEMTQPQAHSAFRNITAHTEFSGLSRCDAVIEAVLERMELKKEVFTTLESVCRENAILATNTSSLSITAIASTCRHPERVLGMHFFNPPQRMKLVEIVRGVHTSEETFNAAKRLAEDLRKTAIAVKDTPGFVVNRVARPYYGEALRILGEGIATVEEIDRIVRLEGGFRMGPFELMDLIGIDVNLAVTESIYEQTYHEPRFKPHTIQRTMVTAGRLGRKTGRGFYPYES